jgi:hypothetical protein
LTDFASSYNFLDMSPAVFATVQAVVIVEMGSMVGFYRKSSRPHSSLQSGPDIFCDFAGDAERLPRHGVVTPREMLGIS